MILTCPNCSARFMIDGHALGPAGRTVRCGACGHSWLQLPEPGTGEPPGTFGANSDLAMAQAGAAAARRAADAAAFESADKDRRRRSGHTGYGEARPRRGLSRVLTWFLFVFIVAALVLGGYRFRQDVVRLWPPATRLYQMLGLAVDPPSGYWLRVPKETIKFRRESEGGIPILVVSGEILNQSDKPQQVAPMRILLLDKENRVLRTERVKIDDRLLEPGKRLPFQTSIPNSPPEAVSVRINFDVNG